MLAGLLARLLAGLLATLLAGLLALAGCRAQRSGARPCPRVPRLLNVAELLLGSFAIKPSDLLIDALLARLVNCFAGLLARLLIALVARWYVLSGRLLIQVYRRGLLPRSLQNRHKNVWETVWQQHR